MKFVNALIIILTLLVTVSCQQIEMKSNGDKTSHNEHSETKIYYTCSMHPQIREKEMGKCPICHMNLTKVEVDEDDESVHQHGEIEKKATFWKCRNYPDVTSEVEDTCPIDGTSMIKVSSSLKASEIVAKVKLRKAQMKHFHPDFFPVTSMKMSKKIRLLGTVLQSEEKESNIPARIGGRVEKVYVKSTGSMVKAGEPVID